MRLFAQGLDGVIRVAGAEDAIRTEVLADLRLQRAGNVDLGQNAEAFALERFLHPRECRVEVTGRLATDVVGHPSLPLTVMSPHKCAVGHAGVLLDVEPACSSTDPRPISLGDAGARP